MVKATSRVTTPRTNTPSIRPTDPVLDLARRLHDVIQIHYASPDAQTSDDIGNQFFEWRYALADTISFTQAETAGGALVQLALAVETLADAKTTTSDASQILKVDRLLRSVLRVMSTTTRVDDAVQSIIQTYSSYPLEPDFMDLVVKVPRTNRVQ
jgi:hypothetical protein